MTDPRLSQGIVQAVDTRFRQLAAQQPRTAYGVVATVDSVNRKCSVYLSGDPVASAGFTYPARMSVGVGDLVRVVVDPRGDRYVQEDMESPGTNRGTSFPPNAVEGDLYYRTDLRELARYDGTRWLGDTLAGRLVQVSNQAANSNTDYSVMTMETDIRIVRWRVNTFTNGTNNGSNFWTVRLRQTDRSSIFNGTHGTVSLAADGGTNWRPHEVDNQDVVDMDFTLGLLFDFVKTGAPGNLYLYGDVLYQRVLG